MRYSVLLAAFLCLCDIALSAPPEVKDSGDRIEVQNSHYVATLTKSRGGTLSSLASPDGGVLLADHRVYTDFGFYAKRGHVGTRNETKPIITVKREDDAVVVSSAGMLRGKEAGGKELIRYRLTYRFDTSPCISVACEVVPLAGDGETSAWLATCFAVPAMREWAVNTIDGIIREDMEEGKGRNYSASKLWIDTSRPEVGFITTGDLSLLAADIESHGPNDLQNIIIHGKTFFLAYYSGAPAKVEAVPHRVTFRLVVGRDDPMQ